jgi:CMP-2-keto-3-deoxyoctulosonic acid synthetase
MAHHEQLLRGDVDALVAYLDRAIPAGSISAKLEDRGDHRIGDARMVVRVYERYSAVGGNRVSLCISILAVGEEMSVSAITAGGSRAVFWKLNTFGESAFLERAVDALRSYSP